MRDLRFIQNPKLNTLSLANTIINNDGVNYIGRFSQLRNLNLEGSSISDASLSTIARLSLDRLDIGRTNITDNGLKSLQGSRISRLDLTSLKITDIGMKSIGSMQNLRELHLWGLRLQQKV